MRITYLFDPLCGWCYGAGPALEMLAAREDVRVELAPTGLFADQGARPIDAAFAAFAWSNDQRIARLTGQVFSDAYRALLLDTPGRMFDSGAMTRGLVAVGLSRPEEEPSALKALQRARYVDGRDTADAEVVAGLLTGAGFDDAARRLAAPDAALDEAVAARIDAARRMMARFGVRGVPALVVEDAQGERLVQGDALYAGASALMARLRAA